MRADVWETVFHAIGEGASELFDLPRRRREHVVATGRCFMARRHVHAVGRFRDDPESSVAVDIPAGTVVRVEKNPTDDQLDVLVAPLDSFVVHIVPAEDRARAQAIGVLFTLPSVILREAFVPRDTP
jgi:hypothetical protein